MFEPWDDTPQNKIPYIHAIQLRNFKRLEYFSEDFQINHSLNRVSFSLISPIHSKISMLSS